MKRYLALTPPNGWLNTIDILPLGCAVEVRDENPFRTIKPANRELIENSASESRSSSADTFAKFLIAACIHVVLIGALIAFSIRRILFFDNAWLGETPEILFLYVPALYVTTLLAEFMLLPNWNWRIGFLVFSIPTFVIAWLICGYVLMMHDFVTMW